jgi:serine/threonine-protein phosphatase CPPED1
MGQFITTKKVFKAHLVKIILASLCILLFMGLKSWNYCAPLPVHDWNKKELDRIKVPDPNNFTFAVCGDNKGNESVFEPLLKDIDHSVEIDFVIDVGDLVPKGQRGFFRRFLKEVQENLAIPFLTAIGNHDLNDKGARNYQEIFGPTYYSFQIGQNSFIVLDATTEGGFNKEEHKWLEDELKKAQASKTRFVFMHVPPFDPRGEGFDKCLRDGNDLLDLFKRYNVTHLFASHIHGYFSSVWGGVSYTITGGAGAGLQGSDPEHFFHHYLRVHVSNGKVDIMVKRIDREGPMASFFDLMEDNVLEWGLLVGAGIFLLSLGLSLWSRHSS